MKIEISKEDLRSILKEFSADPYDAEGPIVELFIDKMFIKFPIAHEKRCCYCACLVSHSDD